MFDLTFLRICLKQNAFFGLFKRIYWRETQKKIVFAFNTDKFSEENIISNFWKQNFVKFADFMDLDSYKYTVPDQCLFLKIAKKG